MILEKEIERYSKLNGYQISSYEDLTCACGKNEFKLYSDDDEGGAFAQCSACKTEYDIEGSRGYVENQTQNVCNCDNENLKIGIGKAIYEGSCNVKWVYVGASCGQCNLVGVYVDWKNT